MLKRSMKRPCRYLINIIAYMVKQYAIILLDSFSILRLLTSLSQRMNKKYLTRRKRSWRLPFLVSAKFSISQGSQNATDSWYLSKRRIRRAYTNTLRDKKHSWKMKIDSRLKAGPASSFYTSKLKYHCNLKLLEQVLSMLFQILIHKRHSISKSLRYQVCLRLLAPKLLNLRSLRFSRQLRPRKFSKMSQIIKAPQRWYSRLLIFIVSRKTLKWHQ